MRKNFIFILLTAVAVILINCTSYLLEDLSSNKNSTKISSRLIEEDYSVDVKQEDIVKIHQKYNSLISDIYDNYSLDFKRLNECEEDSEFVSRLVCMDIENNGGIKNTWFGIVYDEDNNPKEIGFYVDGDYNDFVNEKGNFTIKDTLIQDVGNLFFARSKFKSDIEDFFSEVSSEPGTNSKVFVYKRGIVTASVNGGRMSLKINLIG